MRNNQGFTLIEVVVTVAIIAILSSGILFGINEARQKSRNTERAADLRMLQSALELYKQKYGRYPERCTTVNPALAGAWSGQTSTDYACVAGQQYIQGHIDTTDWDRDGDRTERFTFAPEFIPTLPNDPKLRDAQSGYVYTTNTTGTVYKLMAKRTVEDDSVTYSHALKSCDATDQGEVPCSESTQPRETGNSSGRCDVGMCDRVQMPSGNFQAVDWCGEGDDRFKTTYAVWGGYASNIASTEQEVARLTENVLCEIP